MLAGNVVALLSPMIFIPVLTYAFGPANYDWKSMAAIRLSDDSEIASAAHTDLESIPGTQSILDAQLSEKEQAKLNRASFIAKSMTVFMTIAFLVLWPMPMYGTGYVFSKKFFTGWVVVGIMWIFGSIGCVGLYPLWEGRGSLARVARGIMTDLRGGNGAARAGSINHGIEVEEEKKGVSAGDEKAEMAKLEGEKAEMAKFDEKRVSAGSDEK